MSSASPLDSPGRFGTIQLLRSASAIGTTSNTSDVVTSFGVDTSTVSFGRATNCSVRLYYPAVSPVHARIVFNDDRKAFLEVLGAAGVNVDGCIVYPNAEEGKGGKTKTIALGNGSEIEINGKRFRFAYPPKELRKALAASPARASFRPPNRALRLSMIAAAQVFSPRGVPSPDPRQNLRVLQSPLRLPPASFPAPSSPRTPSPSPARRGAAQHDDEQEEGDAEEDEEEITLVQGAHPRVVEEARDLVILEDVEVQVPGPATQTQDRGRPAGSEAPKPQPPRTPRRQSLHRAVLIRSAQRAVWAASSANSSASNSNSNSGASTPTASTPAVRGWTAPPSSIHSIPPAPAGCAPAPPAQDEEGDTDTDTEEDSDTEAEEAEVRGLRLEVVSVSSSSDASDEEGEYEVQLEGEERKEEGKKLGWRKSLERLWPFGRVKEEVSTRPL
ncbi:hypothetical protein FB451DRAFT_1025621 [Mycena latifolia]|nr:hypothetical protein FB451DRAFT_1025621 [Mycena latifolia]